MSASANELFSDAVESDDGKYRYSLTRVWDTERPVLAIIMLNPSTASKTANDPTIRECMSMARRWGYGGIYVCNLFALRATRPVDMKRSDNPKGDMNDKYLKKMARNYNLILLAWGGHGDYLVRDREVLALLREENPKIMFKCLGKTNSGQPKHPLGIIGSYKLENFT